MWSIELYHHNEKLPFIQYKNKLGDLVGSFVVIRKVIVPETLDFEYISVLGISVLEKLVSKPVPFPTTTII